MWHFSSNFMSRMNTSRCHFLGNIQYNLKTRQPSGCRDAAVENEKEERAPSVFFRPHVEIVYSIYKRCGLPSSESEIFLHGGRIGKHTKKVHAWLWLPPHLADFSKHPLSQEPRAPNAGRKTMARACLRRFSRRVVFVRSSHTAPRST